MIVQEVFGQSLLYTFKNLIQWTFYEQPMYTWSITVIEKVCKVSFAELFPQTHSHANKVQQTIAEPPQGIHRAENDVFTQLGNHNFGLYISDL